MSEITVVMIAKNEQKDLPACIESVKGLADEIVLADGNSTDKTREIAEKLGVKVFIREFDNYAAQKNFALGKAASPWILHLDPDERATPGLKKEIEEVLSNPVEYAGFYIPYENFFLGKKMKHGGLGDEKHLRLFRREASSFTGGLLHEGIEVKGNIGTLKNKIQHNSYPDIAEYFEKFNRYTTFSAQKMFEGGQKFCVSKLLSAPFAFHRRFTFRRGFLDGFRGFLWAVFSAFSVLVKYAKLWELEQRNKK